MDGSTFALSLGLGQGGRLRCVAAAIRGVLFHEEAAERGELNRCWYERQEVRNLVHCLDRRCILLLTNDCNGDGPKAWQLLRDHFNSTETPRLIKLLEKFTTLQLEPTESMVEYLTRA